MTLFLIWNPARKPVAWSDDDYADAVADTDEGFYAERTWSIARKHGVVPGERVFLMRQVRQRGLVASGEIVSDIYDDIAWDGSGGTDSYVDIEWDTVLLIEDRLDVAMLKTKVPDVVWDRLQMSGTEARPPADAQVEKLWARHLGAVPYHSPEEGAGTYPEGTTKQVLVNRYERDRRARQACINHYGTACVVCGINFDKVYGAKVAKGFIHVHHLVEISTVGRGYKVDPIKDLRPVCPNCHAMAHTTRPARSIAALRRAMAAASRRTP